MHEERRRFLKTTLGAGALGVGTFLAAKTGIANDSNKDSTSSSGVVLGTSPKKEILYKKTANWDLFYKSSY